jgi:hypothetical protein
MCYKIASNFSQPHKRKWNNVRRKEGEKGQKQGIMGGIERLIRKKRGVCHIVALPFTLKSILKQKNNYKNSNILPCKIIIVKKYIF